MSLKLELADCCSRRLNDLYSVNEFVNETSKLELMLSNKEKLNLIKNEYFYLENFYQALYDISNLEFSTPYSKISSSSKLSYKQHVEYLYLESCLYMKICFICFAKTKGYMCICLTKERHQ